MPKKYVYIAGAYTGDVGFNVRAAISAGELLSADHGFIPYIPHLNHLWHIVYPHDQEFWYAYDLDWLLKCDCLLRLPGVSTGADNEVKFAWEHHIPVYFSVDRLIEGMK